MNTAKKALENSVTWASSIPKAAETIINTTDPKEGLIKFRANAHRLRLASQSFQRPLRIAVCGENNAGKSTLINALVRDNIAVTDFFEFTYCPMVISYGLHRQASLIFHDGKSLDVDIPSLPEKLRSLKAEGKSHEVKRVSVQAPSEYLKKYEIADVPGVGADEKNAQVAKAFTEDVDAILFVLNATLLGQSELEIELKSLASKFSALCVVLNKVDQIGYDNVDRAVEFVQALDFGKKLPIFAMAAIYASPEAENTEEHSLALTYLNSLEEDFFALIANDAENVKSTAALGKCYRELSTINILLQTAFHEAKRNLGFVEKTCQLLSEAQTAIIDKIDEEVNNWMSYKAFRDVSDDILRTLTTKKITSEEQITSEFRARFTSELAQQQANELVECTNKFLEGELLAAERKIARERDTVFCPFRIEDTVKIVRSEQNRLTAMDYRDSNKLATTPSDNPQELNDVQAAITGGLYATGIATAIGMIGGAALSIPLIVSSFPLALSAAGATFIWRLSNKYKNRPEALPEAEIAHHIDNIRLQLAQQVVDKVFPNMPKPMMSEVVSEKVAQWQTNVRKTLWNKYEYVGQDLEQVVSYIRQGEKLSDEVVQLIKKSSTSNYGNLSELSNKQVNLSPAAVKARYLFENPKQYEIEDKDSLLVDLKAIIEIEELQLNFMDRALTSEELLWLHQVASPNAFLRGWVYDVEENSASRTEFVKRLNKVKDERANSISIQVVKYQGRDSTPLNLIFLAGTDWVLQLTQSLSMLGQRSIGVSLLLSKSEEEAKILDLIYQFTDSSRLLTTQNQAEILFLNL
jgi:hypothetical protein